MHQLFAESGYCSSTASIMLSYFAKSSVPAIRTSQKSTSSPEAGFSGPNSTSNISHRPGMNVALSSIQNLGIFPSDTLAPMMRSRFRSLCDSLPDKGALMPALMASMHSLALPMLINT